jgi:hypothetical protein
MISEAAMALVGKHLRIEMPVVATGKSHRNWRTLPNGERVTVWETSQADLVDDNDLASSRRHIFHIDFVDGVTKGCRAVFFGETYVIREVSDSSKRLRGLELRCER